MTPDLDADDCRRLWCAVILRAIDDAGGMTSNGNDKDTGSRLDQEAARRWFASNDFAVVCSLAGVDPDGVLDAVRAGRVPIGEQARARLMPRGRGYDSRKG